MHSNSNYIEIFSYFLDRLKFSGIIPSNSCLNKIYKSYDYTIKKCMIKEFKNITSTTLHVMYLKKRLRDCTSEKETAFQRFSTGNQQVWRGADVV